MHPVADRRAARILGEALRGVGYSEASVSRLLGDEPSSDDGPDVAVAERRLPQTSLGTAVRAFFLQLPVSTREAVRALGRQGVDALEATGLAEVEDDVVPRVRILPVGELLIASDDHPSEDEEEPPDYVAAYTPTSRVCDALTPRRRVARALDLGTGSGVQALLAARHARHVVATDVNERALAYTELNAGLNGFTNIECRRGSLFEPVAGESFDLITCNAPYVVSPEHRWAYRDSTFEADEISERIVRDAADSLAEAGFATLVVSWIAHDAGEPDERVLAWTEALGCDSWILPVWGSDPLDHAATWNEHLAEDEDTFGDALDEWTDYLAGLGVSWVTEGAVVLHRRSGRGHAARVDEIDDELLEVAGGQIQRAFAARAWLAELRNPDELLDARLSVAMKLQLEQELEPKGHAAAAGAAQIQLAEGTSSAVEITRPMLEVVAGLDGRALRDVVQTAAGRLGLATAQTSRLRSEAVKVSRELLELGALRFD
jgi:SAM-dependent methyltransferase